MIIEQEQLLILNAEILLHNCNSRCTFHNFSIFTKFQFTVALVVATTSAEIYQSRQMLCTVAIKDEEEKKIVAKFIRFQMVFQ